MKAWLRPLPFTLLAAYALSRASRSPVDDTAPSRSAALCSALALKGVTAVPEDVTWLDGPSGVTGAIGGTARAIVRGHGREEAQSAGADPDAPAAPVADETVDLFAVTARLSPEGRVLDLDDVHDLTHTSGADESRPVVHGSHVAYVVSIDDRPEAVHVLDLAGHDARSLDELSRFQRWQMAITDLQTTGQSRGLKRSVFTLVPAPNRAEIAFRDDGMLEVKTDGRTLVFDPAQAAIVDGAAYARVTPEVIAKPPTFAPWMSDRLRAVSWFGDEKNQVLKAVVFTGLEWWKGLKSKALGDTSAKDVADDIGSLNGDKPEAKTFTDPEIGWPPKPLEPLLKPALAGEGQWIALDKDAFITPIPGVPTPFVTTFVRSDPAAHHTRVYITLWDPRLIALHMEAGTVEPVSATGEAGPGQIPRTPEIMGRVVAGFNGGFQATHGEFGMQANGVLYLPPKPYAATVMELRDGTTAFGAWSGPSSGANAPGKSGGSMVVPDDVLSFRQNMTALVQNDKYNPWGRNWWGGVPPGWHDAIHTTRSGLCITKENFVAYFWGGDIGPEPLGRAMLAARCAFGMHLDMNPGLAGFEFYNMQPTSTFKPLGRPLQADWEYEGSLKDMPDFKFRSRRMVKSMGHILFPRYVHRDARDFFYLTARTVLPGTPITAAGASGATGGGSAIGDGGTSEGDGGVWRVKGLPQHGYPYALATTSVRLEGAGERRVRVLRIDPRTVVADSSGTTAHAAQAADAGAATDARGAAIVASFGHAARTTRTAPGAAGTGAPHHDAGAAIGEAKLWLGSHVFTIDKATPHDAVAIADVVPRTAAKADTARAAVGISDDDGMLQWIELLPEDRADGASADAMLKLLERLGCSARGLVEGDLRAFLGGALDIGGEPVAIASTSTRLVRTPAPGARVYFDTPTVPLSVWQPLQAQRVKWRPTLAPPEKPAASSSAAPSGAPAPSAAPK